MISLDFLKKVEVLKGVDDKGLTAVQSCCEEKEFQIGDILFAEGQEAAHLWVVTEGQVDIRFDLPDRPTSEENNISSIFETMAFGWSGLVPPNKYSLSAYCASRKCKVIRMARECLTSLFEKDPRLGYQVMTNVIAVVGKRIYQLQNTASVSPFAKVEILVHLATCGIAAGAREVMGALTEKIAQSNRRDIQVKAGGCLGKCQTEPNVTVKIGGKDPVIYGKMTAEKMRQVFDKHILGGNVQNEFVADLK